MNEIHLQRVPSPVGKSKSDVYECASSETETFSSYSESSVGTSHHNERKNFPPQNPSTCKAMKSVRCRGSSTMMLSQHNKFGFNVSSQPSVRPSVNLDAWEQWLINKLQLERESLKLKKIEAKKEREEAERKQKEKEERIKVAERRHQEWVEENLLKMKLQISAEKRQKKIQKEIEAEKKAKLKADMDLNFRRWKEKLERAEYRKRIEDKAEKEKAARLKEEKKRVAEEKYQEWLQNNKHRFAALKDIATPSPAFVNPNPWIGPNHSEVLKLCTSLTEQPSPAHRSQAKTKYTKQTRHHETYSQTRNTGSRPAAHAVGFIRATSTPLRFAGFRSKTRPQTDFGVKPVRNNRVEVPQPLNGMQYSVSRERMGCRTR